MGRKWMDEGMEDLKTKLSEEEMKVYMKEKVPVIAAKTIGTLADTYVKTRDEIEDYITMQKKFFRSRKDMPGKTKADVLKEIWAELPNYVDGPVPVLDDEMLAELA